MSVIFKRASYDETPPDAIIITRHEAAGRVFDEIDKLGFLQSYPIKLTLGGIAFGTGLTALYIVTNIRKRFKLLKYAYLSMAVPFVYIPVLANYFLFQRYVMSSILLQEMECPVCLQVQAVSLQLGIAVVYPTITTYVTSYLTATGMGTIVAPPIKYIKYASARKEMYDVLRTTTRALSSPIMYNIIIQSVVASLVVWIQAANIGDLMEKVESNRRANIDKLLSKEKLENYKKQGYSRISDITV